MKKSLLLIVFLSLFLFIGKANAYTCEYKNGNSSAIFTPSIFPPEVHLETDLISGSSTYTSNVRIENWRDGSNLGGTTGLPYFVNQLCPTYVVWDYYIDTFFIWSWHYSHAYIAGDEASLNSLYSILEDDRNNSYEHFPLTLTLVRQNTPSEETTTEYPKSCLDFSKNGVPGSDKPLDAACENNKYFSCLWIDRDTCSKYSNNCDALESQRAGYCNTDALLYVKCGNAYDIPMQAPKIISFIINLFKIATPIILILVSIIDLVKALAASKDDQITKAKSNLVRKLIAAVLVFMVIYIVQFVIIRVADDDEAGNVTDCLSCFMNNSCSESVYYKTYVSGSWKCTLLSGGEISCSANETRNSN